MADRTVQKSAKLFPLWAIIRGSLCPEQKTMPGARSALEERRPRFYEWIIIGRLLRGHSSRRMSSFLMKLRCIFATLRFPASRARRRSSFAWKMVIDDSLFERTLEFSPETVAFSPIFLFSLPRRAPTSSSRFLSMREMGDLSGEQVNLAGKWQGPSVV